MVFLGELSGQGRYADHTDVVGIKIVQMKPGGLILRPACRFIRFRRRCCFVCRLCFLSGPFRFPFSGGFFRRVLRRFIWRRLIGRLRCIRCRRFEFRLFRLIESFLHILTAPVLGPFFENFLFF